MPHCPTCGKEVSEKDKFCPKCGADLSIPTQPSPARVGEQIPTGPDALGLLSAGVILIVIASTYIKNPINPSVVINYFESMGKQGTFLKPPPILTDAAVFFLYAAGVWGIVLSGLRIVFERSARKALGDLTGGFFSFFLAYLLTKYAAGILTGRLALGYFVIAIGLLVIVNALVHLAFREKQ